MSQQSAFQQQQQSQAQLSNTKIVDSFGKTIKEQKSKVYKSEEFSKIQGWKYDEECKAIMIKIDYGRCKYYYHTHDILKLLKAEFQQLSKLKMVNHGMYALGYELEEFLKSQAKKD